MVHPVNQLSSPSQSSSLGTLTTQASSFGHFNPTANEALVATLDPGPSDYFVFPVTDPWLISVDPGANQISLNSEQSVANANGTYTFVVSLADPGVHNWLNTTGLHEGTIMVRGPSSSSIDASSITAQVVPLSELASVLPSETQYVTPEQRKEQLAQHIAGYALRLGF